MFTIRAKVVQSFYILVFQYFSVKHVGKRVPSVKHMYSALTKNVSRIPHPSSRIPVGAMDMDMDMYMNMDMDVVTLQLNAT
jgi:hypothetical protein